MWGMEHIIRAESKDATIKSTQDLIQRGLMTINMGNLNNNKNNNAIDCYNNYVNVNEFLMTPIFKRKVKEK